MQSLASLVLAGLCLSASLVPVAGPAWAWEQVARTGQSVPGTDHEITVFFQVAWGADFLVAGDGRVFLAGAESTSGNLGLLSWSEEAGLTEPLALGGTIGDEPSLPVDGIALLDVETGGDLVFGVLTFGDECRLMRSVLLLGPEGDSPRLVGRCDELLDLLPPMGPFSSVDAVDSIGMSGGKIGLRVASGDDTTLLIGDELDGFSVPVRKGDPLPGEAERVVSVLHQAFWAGGHLSLRAYAALDPDAPEPAPGDGLSILTWDAEAGLAEILRADPQLRCPVTSGGWNGFYDLRGDDAGGLVWQATESLEDCETRRTILGWSGDGPPVPLVQEDAPAPGEPSLVLGSIFDFRLAGPDQLVFHAESERAGSLYREALYTTDADGVLALRVEEGDPAPEGPGVSYEGFELAAAGGGRTAFYAWLSQGAAYGWIDEHGGVHPLPLPRAGDVLEFAPGDFRVVEKVDPNRVVFDRELRFVAALVWFEHPPGGTAVYRAALEVPEPRSGGSSAGLALGLLWRLRRRASGPTRNGR